MHIVFVTHPSFQGSQSMPRYAKMLVDGLRERNHKVEIWTARKYFHRLPLPLFTKKWLGYMDQFLVFPISVKRKLKKYSSQTLFVITDQALGPWIPLICNRPHVIHCHDFIAQKSALGEIPENKIGITGRLYQYYIKLGYRKGKNFISISKNTQFDLHKFLKGHPNLSEVVYNGFNQDFKPADNEDVPMILSSKLNLDLKSGFILHVGGNQFYKNRKGVVEIYNCWRQNSIQNLPLLMVGASPNNALKTIWNDSPFFNEIHFIEDVSDDVLKMCYQSASVLLFPSLNEGFGWPIAEAMASGCPVITTNKPPMTEVGENCCSYIPPYPNGEQSLEKWVYSSAVKIEKILNMPKKELDQLRNFGLKNSLRFDTTSALDRIESIYKKVLNNDLQEI